MIETPTCGVRLRVDSGWTLRLRDYFLRLGGDARIVSDGVVDVTVDAHELKEFVRSWTTASHVPVTVDAVPSKAVVIAPPPPPTPAPSPAPQRPQPPAATNPWLMPPRLGELLVKKGMITREQLDQALATTRATGEMLGRVLIRERLVYEDELARTLAQQWDFPFVNLAVVGVDFGVMRMLPAQVGIEAAAAPVRLSGERVTVAFADPSDERCLAAVHGHIGKIDLAVAALSDITALWHRAARAPF